jgi:hypothetical protein
MIEVTYSPEAYARWSNRRAEEKWAQRTAEIAGWQKAKALGLVPEPRVPRPLPPPSPAAESRWQAAMRERHAAQHASAVQAYRLLEARLSDK